MKKIEFYLNFEKKSLNELISIYGAERMHFILIQHMEWLAEMVENGIRFDNNEDMSEYMGAGNTLTIIYKGEKDEYKL